MRAYYHGCWQGIGHHLYAPSGRRVTPQQLPKVFPCRVPVLDAGFLPPDGPQVEGRATLTHLNGWTILAFWDRSLDSRNNSNSAFVFEALLPFAAACEAAEQTFPAVWGRFRFGIQNAKLGE